MPTLTRRQAELLAFIRGFISSNQYPPSHRQIATNLGYSAVKSVQQLLQQLEKKGYTAHTPGVARSLRLVHKLVVPKGA